MSSELRMISRRQFHLCIGGGVLSLPAWARKSSEPMPWESPANVCRVYLGVAKPTWPRPDLDFKQEIAGIEARLGELERKHHGKVRFTGGDRLQTPEDVPQWAAKLSGVDAVLVLDLTSSTAPILRAMRDVHVPMLLFSRPYAGWSYLDFAAWRQAGKRADLVASSDFGDLDPYIRVFYTMHHLRHSKVLVVRPGGNGNAQSEAFTKQFGTTIRFPAYKDLGTAYDAVEAHTAEQAAAEFVKRAVRVVEPSPEEVRKALRFYLGSLELLKREKANALTIDCLGGFRRGDLPAYPCVAFSKLNDAGYYGVCEADLPSTMTQLLVTSFCDRPGFVSDPVFDTSRSEVIHAHCVSATALHGIGSSQCPYVVRSHMEDNAGVSIQVYMPIGETVTVAKFVSAAKLVVSTAEVAGNIESSRGCRTQIRTKVANARKFLEGYTGGLHRVLFYGDYVDAIEKMGRLMGFEVVNEAS